MVEWNFNEDAICADLLGGLLYQMGKEDRIEKRAEEDNADDVDSFRRVMVWSDPWSVTGWEMSSGFAKKWAFLLKGCGEMIEASNFWRRARGEEELVLEVE
jgi:hypothetical protein